MAALRFGYDSVGSGLALFFRVSALACRVANGA